MSVKTLETLAYKIMGKLPDKLRVNFNPNIFSYGLIDRKNSRVNLCDDDFEVVNGVVHLKAGRLGVVSTPFQKADVFSVGFTKTGASAIALKAGTAILVAGRMLSFGSDAPVTFSAGVAGTDYAIYATTDGKLLADSNWSAPTGYTVSNSVKIGGFHYDLAGEINEFSIWDLKFRPTADPRGMALVSGGFWADIYLLNQAHATLGTSRSGQTIADGNSLPTIHANFGTGSYTNCSWLTCVEALGSHGKQLLSIEEFMLAAYGVTELDSCGIDPVSTSSSAASAWSSVTTYANDATVRYNGRIYRSKQGSNTNHTPPARGDDAWWSNFRSKWGLEQATGSMLTWGKNLMARSNWEESISIDTGGRGDWGNLGGATESSENESYTVAVLMGGAWYYVGSAGSRFASWSSDPSGSDDGIGARGRCDHLRLV